jgi:hypothetical protein
MLLNANAGAMHRNHNPKALMIILVTISHLDRQTDKKEHNTSLIYRYQPLKYQCKMWPAI